MRILRAHNKTSTLFLSKTPERRSATRRFKYSKPAAEFNKLTTSQFNVIPCRWTSRCITECDCSGSPECITSPTAQSSTKQYDASPKMSTTAPRSLRKGVQLVNPTNVQHTSAATPRQRKKHFRDTKRVLSARNSLKIDTANYSKPPAHNQHVYHAQIKMRCDRKKTAEPRLQAFNQKSKTNVVTNAAI